MTSLASEFVSQRKKQTYMPNTSLRANNKSGKFTCNNVYFKTTMIAVYESEGVNFHKISVLKYWELGNWLVEKSVSVRRRTTKR